MDIQIWIYLTVSSLKNNVLFEKRTKNFLRCFAAKLYANCVIVLKSTITHNDFLGVEQAPRKSVICCLTNSHNQSKTAMFSSSKLQFFVHL